MTEAAENSTSATFKPALELRGVSKKFSSVVALDSVSFTVRPNSVHALLGENGAGKTTLMRIAFGMVKPDNGQILRNGQIIDLSSPSKAIAAGIGMVHQQFSLVPAMTVAENIALGGRGLYRLSTITSQMEDVTRRTGLRLDPEKKVSELTSSERQKLEIIRTFAHDAQLLILDEPTAVLTPGDIGEMFQQLRAFAEAGGSVVLITHKLQDALEHADDVTVLRRGRVVLSGPMKQASRTSLTEAMLGSTVSEQTSSGKSARGATSIARVAWPSSSDNYIEIFPGEILGVAALEGAAIEPLRSLAGRSSHHSDVKLFADVGFVPENRQEDAVIPDFSLTENLALRGAGARRGLMDWKHLRGRAELLINDFDVRADGPNASARSLSGGNQQKFVLGRELGDNVPLLVMENPTQGLDVHAAAAIHQRIREARTSGTAVVFYSSDLDELAELADRVIVVGRDGFESVEPNAKNIGRVLLGVATTENHVAR